MPGNCKLCFPGVLEAEHRGAPRPAPRQALPGHRDGPPPVQGPLGQTGQRLATDGALHLLLELQIEMKDMDVVRRLTAGHRVTVIPGSTFGIESGCVLRAAFGALNADAVSECKDRLVERLGRICSATRAPR